MTTSKVPTQIEIGVAYDKTEANPWIAARTEGLRAAYLAHGGSLADAPKAALAALDNALNRQAALLAFKDLFVALLVMCAGTLVLLLLFERPRKGAKPPADAH